MMLDRSPVTCPLVGAPIPSVRRIHRRVALEGIALRPAVGIPLDLLALTCLSFDVHEDGLSREEPSTSDVAAVELIADASDPAG